MLVDGLYRIDLPCGASVELEFLAEAHWVPPTGDGWTTPRIPGHWETDDDWNVQRATLYSIGGGFRSIDLVEPSLAWRFFEEILLRVPVEVLYEHCQFPSIHEVAI